MDWSSDMVSLFLFLENLCVAQEAGRIESHCVFSGQVPHWCVLVTLLLHNMYR